MPVLETVLSIIAPHNCLLCSAEGKLICNWCSPDAFPELPSRCYRCKQLTSDFAVCDKCKKHTSLKRVWIKTNYEGTAADILRLYKYERARSASADIASAMSQILPYLESDTVVVPVPTATSRIRGRGYDQAALLARHIAHENKLVWINAVAHLTQSRQVGSSRSKRLSQLQDTFHVTKPKLIQDSNILIIDDVVTTGATIETMAKVLKQAGAKSVHALAFAQKQ